MGNTFGKKINYEMAVPNSGKKYSGKDWSEYEGADGNMHYARNNFFKIFEECKTPKIDKYLPAVELKNGSWLHVNK